MDAINPNHYKGFSNGAEVIYITENLTFNAGNVVKYGARAGRLDESLNKNDAEGRIEDLKKSRWYADREIERLGGNTSSDNLEFVVNKLDDYSLRVLGIATGNLGMANKIIDRRNHPAYSNYELVLTLRKA